MKDISTQIQLFAGLGEKRKSSETLVVSGLLLVAGAGFEPTAFGL
jgi:hypothetical protein